MKGSLQILAKSKPKLRKILIENVPESVITAIYECCLNMLKGTPLQRLKFFRQAWASIGLVLAWVSLEINRDKNRIKGERRGCWVRARVGRREERKKKRKPPLNNVRFSGYTQVMAKSDVEMEELELSLLI